MEKQRKKTQTSKQINTGNQAEGNREEREERRETRGRRRDRQTETEERQTETETVRGGGGGVERGVRHGEREGSECIVVVVARGIVQFIIVCHKKIK